MALTNAERQARHRERQREKLRNAVHAEPLRNDASDALKLEIEALKKKLAKAEEDAAESASLASMREARAREAEEQRDNAQTEVLFYKSDKDHLEQELSALRNGVPTDAVLAWLRSVDREDEAREAFLRKLRHLVSDWFVPIDWYEDCAAGLHIARGTPVPEGLAKKTRSRVT